MDAATREAIYSIAKEIRAWAEEQAARYPYFPMDLCGLCAISARKLWEALNAAGIEASIGLWMKRYEGHAFVVAHGHIVDVTATQFGREIEPVVIKPAADYDTLPAWWQYTDIYQTSIDFLEGLKHHKWIVREVTLPHEDMEFWGQEFGEISYNRSQQVSELTLQRAA